MLVAIVLGVCTVASVVVFVDRELDRPAYYGTDARAVEVLIGAMLAVAFPVDRRRGRSVGAPSGRSPVSWHWACTLVMCHVGDVRDDVALLGRRTRRCSASRA